VIEKHFTLDKNLPGPDHRASLEPAELEEMVWGIRLVKKVRGSSVKAPVESELEVRDVARRSIVAKVDIPAGTVINEDMLAFKRPGTGVAPKDSTVLIGKITTQDINKNEMLKFEELE